MLPDGFRLETHPNGNRTLYLGDRQVAQACPANHDPEPPWRICTNVDTMAMRYRFTNTEAGAIRLIEAWAVRWEAQIRENYSRASSPFGHLATTSGVERVTTSHPRAKARRR